MIAAPISHPLYPQPSDNHPGGGFRYIRDAQPFNLTLPPCPKCSSAKANPAVLSGPADDSLLSVKITGVTPANAVIVIKAVAQSTPVKCNSGRFVGNDTASQVRPNAKIDPGKSTVYLRRTRTPGEINPLTYTIYFDATSAGGTCSGQVSVCVPVVGFDCNAYLGFDATATRFCQY